MKRGPIHSWSPHIRTFLTGLLLEPIKRSQIIITQPFSEMQYLDLPKMSSGVELSCLVSSLMSSSVWKTWVVRCDASSHYLVFHVALEQATVKMSHRNTVFCTALSLIRHWSKGPTRSQTITRRCCHQTWFVIDFTTITASFDEQ